MGQQTFVKILFGGERQWCRVMERLDGGKLKVMVDNKPLIDGAPYRSEHVIKDSDVLEYMTGQPTLKAVR